MRVIDLEEKWDKNIQLEFTLRELQILYDSLGKISWNQLKSVYEEDRKIPKEKIPFNDDDVFVLWEDLKNLINLKGGCTE